MKIIVGLGNPGEKYKNTRHNLGFLAIDFILGFDGYITAKPGHDFKSEMFTWQPISENHEPNQKVIFLKPQTYMNDSGLVIKVISNFYKIDLQKDLLVIHDEVDLPFGEMKFTESSSAAGHNGIKSIIQEIGTQDFSRLRVGVESRANREDMPTDAFVLQNFTPEQQDQLATDILPKIKLEIEKFIKNS
jgi:PTH1 family peptidyl-tRNA hydrolase